MEINQKINQYNFDGRLHGYWNNLTISLKVHYFNGNQIGLFSITPSVHFLGNRMGHIINKSKLGYYLSDNSSQFIFKSDKKFGEEIIWK